MTAQPLTPEEERDWRDESKWRGLSLAEFRMVCATLDQARARIAELEETVEARSAQLGEVRRQRDESRAEIKGAAMSGATERDREMAASEQRTKERASRDAEPHKLVNEAQPGAGSLRPSSTPAGEAALSQPVPREGSGGTRGSLRDQARGTGEAPVRNMRQSEVSSASRGLREATGGQVALPDSPQRDPQVTAHPSPRDEHVSRILRREAEEERK